LKEGGIGFVTFGYSVDGVTIEIEKYAKLYRKNIPGIPIHYIGGGFKPEARKIIEEETKTLKLSVRNKVGGLKELEIYVLVFPHLLLREYTLC